MLRSERLALSTGVELDTSLGGPPSAPPILFLHGFPESHRTWRHQLADLARDHQVAAPDQRGYARSSKPGGVPQYSVDKIVADALALADHLGWDRFTLAGHDWGGAVAWAAALKHPDRVARLVIANAPHPQVFRRSLLHDPAQRKASAYIAAFRFPGFISLAEALGPERIWKLFSRTIPTRLLSEEDKAAYLDEWSQPGAIRGMLNWYRAMDPPRGEPSDDFPPVTQPALVVWGMRDAALLPVQIEGLGRYIPDLTLERLPGAGHFSPWEAPTEVTAAMRRFLAARPLAA